MKTLARTGKIVMAAIVLLTACLTAFGSAESVVVGIMHNSSFPQAEMMKNSFELALEAINKAGGINGNPLALQYADDQGLREAGEKAFKSLAGQAAVMLLGGYASSNTIYTARLADKYDIPFLICTAADDRITQRGWKNVFRMNPPADEYASGLENLLLEKIHPKSLAVVYENSPFGTGSAMRMMWFCREHDIELKRIVAYHKERLRQDYFEKIISPLQQDPPDVIYMVSYLKDGLMIVNAIKKMGIPSLLCGGAGGFTHHKFITETAGTAENLMTVTLWSREMPYPGAETYYNSYQEKFGEPPDYHGAEAYSALMVAADALARAKWTTPDNIRNALMETNLKTPFGPVRFNNYQKFERQNSLPTGVLQIQNGKFVGVWPHELSTGALILP